MYRTLSSLAIFFGILISCSGIARADDVTPLEIGQPAPPFDLPGIDDRNYTLEDFAYADILVVVFTCNHCPTAQAYEDRLIQLTTDYRDRGVAVVAIQPNDPLAVRLDELGYTDLNDTLPEMKIRARDKGFNFPYLTDAETQDVVRAYGPLATPHVFIFDKDRTLRYQGRIDDGEKPRNITSNDTRNAIDALLDGKQVPVETTKVFGCTIKWADKRADYQRYLDRWAQEPVMLEKIDLAGIETLMKNDTGNLLMLNVWATWCGPCVAEFSEFVDMNRMYRNREFKLVMLSTDGPDMEEKVLNFLKKKEASMTNYLYAEENVYPMIEAVDSEWPGPLPYTVLVAPGGEILYRQLGEIDVLELKRATVEYIGRVYQ